MPKVNIEPQAVLLTSGQAVTFEAKDESGNPVLATWTLSPPAVGGLILPSPAQPGGAPPPTSSATYVAPTVNAAQTVAIVAIGPAPAPNAGGAAAGAPAPANAATAEDSASATVSLTPDTLVVVPAKVELKPGQKQKFVALVAGAAPSSTEVNWVWSPPIGNLTPDATSSQEATYEAVEVRDSVTVNIIAASKTTGKQASAAVSLTSPPWTGRGVQLLGAYLLLVFMLVFLIVLLWPPALPAPETAAANRIQAESTLKDKTAELQKTERDLATAQATLATAQAAGEKKAPSGATPDPAKVDQVAAAINKAQADYDAAKSAHDRAVQAENFADHDLDKKRKIEENVNNPEVETKLAGKINRELDLLWLVLLSGCLGTFLHMSQSFSDYIGNQTIKSNWAWWYYLRPFIGAGLALVFYAALRGGVLAIATGSSTTAGSEINPFGLVSISALVGMFSKAATTKLGEVFDTLFKSDAAKSSKDKLNTPAPQSSTTAGGTSGAAK